jgi:hypothetical protein
MSVQSSGNAFRVDRGVDAFVIASLSAQLDVDEFGTEDVNLLLLDMSNANEPANGTEAAVAEKREKR